MLDEEELAVDEVIDDPLLEESAPSEEVLDTEIPEVVAEPEVKTPESKGFQKRIDKRTADYYREKGRADTAESKLAEYEANKAVPVGEEPTLEQHDYDEAAYNKALVKHYAQGEVAKIQTAQVQKNQKIEVDKILSDYSKKVDAVGNDDFYDIVRPLTEQQIFSPDTWEVIMTDENGPAIELHLANNLELANKIGNMPLGVQARELGRISANISAKPLKKTTNAPVPIKRAGSGGIGTKDMTNASMAEIMASDL